MAYRLLILSDLTPPQFAPRITALLERLPRQWQVDVVTEEIKVDHAASHGQVECDRLEHLHIDRLSLKSRFTPRLYALADALCDLKSRQLLRHLTRHYDLRQYDLVVGLSYRTFPLPAVAYIARRYGIPALMDCRDIVEEYTPQGFLPIPLPRWLPARRLIYRVLRNLFIVRRRQALQYAATITTVSDWHQACLAKQHPAARVVSIPNGYDENLFIPAPPSTPHLPLKIRYTGRLLSLEMRDPSLLFEALLQPPLLAALERREILLEWYTDRASVSLLQGLLSSYPESLQAAQRFLPMQPFTAVPKLLAEADILLLLGNRERPDGPHGMVTTKLFEAMAMLRPILFVRSDQAIVAHHLECHGGALAGERVERVVDFLLAHLDRVRRGETLPNNIFSDHHRSYTRDAMASAFLAEFIRLLPPLCD